MQRQSAALTDTACKYVCSCSGHLADQQTNYIVQCSYLFCWLNHNSGNVTDFSQWTPVLSLCVVHMEFIVERLALEQDFLEALGLSSESIRLPSVAGIVEPFWSMVSRGTISTIGQMTNLLLLRNS